MDPFFIIGNDRSGTTMLRLILDRSKEVAIPTESMFLIDFVGVRNGSIDLSRPTNSAAFIQRVWTHPRVQLWRLDGDPPTVPEGLSHLDSYRFCVEAPFRRYAEMHGKQRWADKTPAYIHHVDAIYRVWKNAKFVELVRDGRDVALSVKSLPFGANTVYTAAKDWAIGIRAGVAAAARSDIDTLTVRYEDLVSDPHTVVSRICGFLDLDFSAEMLAIERTDRQKLVPGESGWFENVWAGINRKSVKKWSREMSIRDQVLFASVASRELQYHGYEVPDGILGPPRRREVLVLNAIDAFLRGLNFVRLRIVQERGRELRHVVRRKLHSLVRKP